MRLFVAIELPKSVRRSLADSCKHLVAFEISQTSFVRPENLHLTIKFLGEVADPAVQLLCDELVQIPPTGSICLSLNQIECLPKHGPVRVISVGVAGDINRLQTLYDSIEGASERLGVRKEGRRFFPHITIARVRRAPSVSVRSSLKRVALPRITGEAFEVREFVLMQSVLDRRGAKYVPIARSPITLEE